MTDRIEPIGPRRDAPPVQPVRLTPAERERRRREREERRRRGAAPPRPQGSTADGDAPPRLDLRA
jgi:hypothetical protein